MNTSGPARHVVLVSFSGVDGAGKSTQIEALCQHLQSIGKRVTLIRFWDDVSRLKALRESVGHKVFKGDKGVGTPEAPICRKDKNIRSWPMTCIRLALYFIDAISTRNSVRRALRSDADVVIYDRYCYDELANLSLHNPWVRRWVSLLLIIIPTLDKSYLLDADPMHARARKPEYPLAFVRENRAAYLQLQQFIGRMIVISPSSIEDVTKAIWRHAVDALAVSPTVKSDPPAVDEEPFEVTHTMDGPATRPAT